MLEVVVVVLIALSLTGVIMFSAQRIIKTSKITDVIATFNSYSQSVSYFYQNRGYLPGDVPLSEISGGINQVNIVSSITNIQSGGVGTNYTMGSGHITPIKSMLSFQQMFYDGLIKPGIIDGSATISSLNINLNQGLIPKVKNFKNAGWVLFADKQGQTPQSSPSGSVIYSNLTLYNYFKSRPRLSIFGLLSYCAGCTVSDVIGIPGGSLPPPLMGSGGVPAEYASEIDLKIDDGSPNSGTVVSDDPGLDKCLNTAKNLYNSSKTSSLPSESCIMTFLIDLLI